MPYKDPEKRKQYLKEYREKNKEKAKEYNKQYNIDNFEKVKINKAQYLQTEKGTKINRISELKRTGLICDDIDALYEYYINTTHCEKCNVELFNGKKTISTKKTMDHCHITGKFRNVLCSGCNVRRRQSNF